MLIKKLHRVHPNRNFPGVPEQGLSSIVSPPHLCVAICHDNWHVHLGCKRDHQEGNFIITESIRQGSQASTSFDITAT
jgi:hypothetical protein